MMSSCPKCGVALDMASMDGLCPRCVALDFLTPTEFDAGPGVLQNQRMPAGEECRVGDYELVEELGRGGMGVVYRARQLSLGREVALKFLLHGALAGDQAVARFRAEATAAAGLRHPNIVTTFEIGEDRGRLFQAMELVQGQSLAEKLRDGPLPAVRAAGYLCRLAKAVQHAHGRGVLHRDLKPANVLIDEHDEPRITDFGLAKRITESEVVAQDPQLTSTGQVLGTPAYISPEQAGGGAVDVRSDVYSLGALFYHLLAGRPPFVGESATHVLRQVAEVEPVALRILNPSLPRDLETVCLKCLEKEPSRRYASADELARDLARFLNDEPIGARPVSGLERAWRWCRRKPALTASFAGIALLLIGIAGVSHQAARRIESLRLVGLTNLYASDMRLAQQAIAESKFGMAAELLDRHRPSGGDPDLRGFEWRHFADQCRSDAVATLGRHSSQAQRAAYSPDARLIATAATDVRVWDAVTRQLRGTFPCEGFVRALTFSPDSRYLASAEYEGTLRCFDLHSGLEVARHLQTGPIPFALQWPSNSSTLHLWALGTRAAWDWRTDHLTDHISLPARSSRDTISDNGIFASLQRSPWRLTVWRSNVLTGEYPLVGPALAITASADGRRFGVGEFSGMLNFFPLEKGGTTNRVLAHRGAINALAFSPDGTRVASGGADQLIRIWDAVTGRRLNELRGHRRVVWSLAFSPDGNWLVSGDGDGEVKLWSTRANRHEMLVSDGRWAMLSVEGASWVLADSNGLKWFNEGEAEGRDLPPHLVRESRPIAVSTNGVLWPGTNGFLQLLRRDGLIVPVRHPENWGDSAVQLSPDARYLGYDSRARQGTVLWDLHLARPVGWMNQTALPGRILTISANSRLGAFGDAIGQLRVVELATGRELLETKAHKAMTYAADFSRDGSQVVSAGHDGYVRLWSLATGRLVGEFRSSVESFWTVALAPDGRRVAAGTMESSIVIWDVPSRQEVATLQLGEPLAPVEGCLRFTSDGTALLLENKQLLRWDAPALQAR